MYGSNYNQNFQSDFSIRSRVIIHKLLVQPKANLTAVSQMPNQGLHHLVLYHYFNVE